MQQYLFLNILKSFLICIFAGLTPSQLYAQNPEEEENDSSRINLIFSRKMKGLQKSDGDYVILQGEVHFQQNDMHLWCNQANRYPQKKIIAYGDVALIQAEKIEIFSDSLFYDGNTRKARLNNKVELRDSSMNMYTNLLLYDLNTRIATYPNGAKVISDSTELISKTGYYDANTNIAYFSDSVRMKNPDYKLYADSLAFHTQKEIAYFKSPTYIFNEEDLIYCEGGYFDNKNKNARLTGNPYYLKRTEKGSQKAKGDTIIYDGALKKYYLIGNASYEDGDKIVTADTIERDEVTDNFNFKGNPKFKSLDSTESQTIDSKYSFYDSKTETIIFREDVLIVDKNQKLLADSLDYTKQTRTGIARGRVIWQDTVSNIMIMCGEAIYNDSTKAFVAKENPVLVTKMDNDSLWLSSDTLKAFSDEKDKEKKNFFAYNHVKIFKKDIQGLCDSLTYSQADSMFQFFNKPVLWVDSVQFIADTIRATMQEGKINRVSLRQNSLIISTDEEVYFNQIKGMNMLAFFNENQIQNLDIKSNGKAIYYAKDDQQRYMGVNDVNCTDMNMYFSDNKIVRIKFTVEPKSVLYPMGMTDHNALRLKEFKWLEADRPKSKFEIVGNRDWYGQSKFLKADKLIKTDTLTKVDTLSQINKDSATLKPLSNENKKGKLIGKLSEEKNETIPKTENKLPVKSDKLKKKEDE